MKFKLRKTETVTGLTQEEWDNLTKPVSKEIWEQRLKEVEEINKLFKKITPEEAIKLLNKEKN